MAGINPVLRTMLIAFSIFPPKYPAAIKRVVAVSESPALRFIGSVCPMDPKYIIQKYIYGNGFYNHMVNPPDFVCG
jgi:hypothetical protein